MQSFLELLRQRRSVRAFLPQPLSEPDIAALREAALRAPSSRGINPWHFIFVDDTEIIARLAQSKMHGSAFLGGAPLAIVVCADDTASDVWVEDCSIAAITLHYAAADLGLGSCWAQIRNRPHNEAQSAEDYLQQLLRLPPHLRVEAIIGIGLPAETKSGHPASALMQDRLHRNHF